MQDLNIIVKMVFGSHLYGTDTKESEQEYKGVFMPTQEEVLLNRVPKSHSFSTKKGNESKNDPEDVDTEIYSLHYFIQLACGGQTVALDMLHAPDNMILKKTHAWDWIVFHRKEFYTKSLKAFIGYARRQAAKYGIKGSRLNDAQRVVEFLKKEDQVKRLSDVWGKLPVGEHIKYPPSVDGLKMYQVCGKQFQETARVGYILPILEKFCKDYGARAQQAANNEGIDWKAISHALRAAYQVKELLTKKTNIFPLKEADLLVRVKNGEMDYTTEVVPLLEGLMDEVEVLSEESDLPQKVNRGFWDNVLIALLKTELFDKESKHKVLF